MLMDRLTTQPIDLSPSLIETLDCIMLIKRMRREGSYIRRITGLYEVLGYDKRKGIDENKVFGWDPQTDEYRVENKSMLLKQIADQNGIDHEKIKRDLRNKQHVLNYMQEEQIKHFRKVGDVISRYYSDPKSILEEIGETFNSRQEELELSDA
jgi:flagellar protein FlaI